MEEPGIREWKSSRMNPSLSEGHSLWRWSCGSSYGDHFSIWVIGVIFFLCLLLTLTRSHSFPCSLPVVSVPSRHASAVNRTLHRYLKLFTDLCVSKTSLFLVQGLRLCVTSKSNMLPTWLLSDRQGSNRIVYQSPQTAVLTQLNRQELLKSTYHEIMVYHVRN